MNMLPIPAALRRSFAGVTAFLLPGLALANPAGGQVVAGQVGISNPTANGTVVTQGSASAIVNWQSFNVAGNEYVQFIQPSSSAVILNRVVGGSPSAIFGDISANGRVFLINPQGVLFAPGSRVDVGALVASTMDIRNSDFLAGRYHFAGTGAPGASVVNGGTINTADGGFVVLAGDYVNNTGVIQARLGTVALAGGSAMTLTTDRSGLISYKVDAAALSAKAGVANSGTLLADGGRVIMTAKVANDLVSTAVNNTGLIRAQGISEHDGRIELTGSGGGVIDSGTLDASNASGDGGSVTVSSDRDIDIQSGAQILASGADRGGDVRIVADGTLSTRAGSLIDARALDIGGVGGLAELSGHQAMTVRGDVGLGRGGNLLLDPTDLTISGGGGTSNSATVYQNFIQSQLQSGTSLRLVATHSITLDGMTGGSLDGVSGYGGSLLLGIGLIDGTGKYVRGTSGNISFSVPTNTIQIDGVLDIEAGSQTGTIKVGNLIGGNVNLDAPQGITAGNVAAVTGNLTIVGDFTENGGGTLFAEQVFTAGNISTTAGNLQIIGGDVTVGNLSVTNAQKDASTLSIDSTGFNGYGGGVNVSGSITVSGGGGAGSFNHTATMASATIVAATDVTVAGAIDVNATTFTRTENLGQLATTVKRGNADLSVKGQNIQLADVSVSAVGNASFAAAATQSLVIGGLLDVTASRYTSNTTNAGTQNVIDSGLASIALNSAASAAAATVQTNGIKATGPNVSVRITGSTLDLRDHNGDGKAITANAPAGGVSASGAYVKKTGFGSDDVESNFGLATVRLTANGNPQAPGTSILSDSIDVTGPTARLLIGAASDVSITGDLSAQATGYFIKGNATQVAALTGLGQLIQGYGGGGTLAPPILLTSGTTNWGTARVLITGNSSDSPFAGNVAISGGITAQGFGDTDVSIGATALNIGGAMLVTAGKGTLQGIAAGSSASSGYQVSRTITNSAGNGPATYGLASSSIVIANTSGDVHLGSLTVRGYSAQAGIFGGHDVTIDGDVAVNGKYGGAAPDFKETTTYTPSYGGTAVSGSTEWKGDRNYFAIGDAGGSSAPSGTVTVGNIAVSGYGFAGITLRGASINVGNVALTQADGLFMSNDPGRASSSYSLSNPGAALQIASTAQTPATVQSITVKASGALAQNLDASVTGNYTVSAASYTSAVSGVVFLPHPLAQGSPSSPFGPSIPADQSLSGVSVTAASIALNTVNDLDLSGQTLTASAGLTINAGGNIGSSGQAPASLTADALSVKAGGSINLSSASITVGSGTAAFGSDPQLLAAIGNDPKGRNIPLPVSGPNAAFKGQFVSLGNITVQGGYVYVESLTSGGQPGFSIGSITSPSSTLLDYVADAGSLPIGAAVSGPLSPRATVTTPGGGNLDLSGTITLPSGVTTLVYGGTNYTGNITVAGGTLVSPGTANLVFASQGTISGADNLPTSGIVVVLNEASNVVGELPLQPQDYLPPDTGGVGAPSLPGDPYSTDVNGANEGQIDVQTAPQGSLSCSGSL